MSCRLQEGEGHASTNQDRIGPGGERAHDAELVFDLGASDDHDEGSVRRVEQSRQHLDLAGHESTGGRGQVLGGPDDRGVCAVGDAEGVVDVDVLALDQLAHELGVVALFSRGEAQVLEQLDSLDQLVESRLHRAEVERRIGLALRAAEVGAGGDMGPPVLEPPERRQSRTDPEVVGDDALAAGVFVIGTLKSTRTSTCLPSRSPRSSSSGTPRVTASRSCRADDAGEVHQSVRVSPLVVVPAEHLGERRSTRRSRSPWSASSRTCTTPGCRRCRSRRSGPRCRR